MLKRYTPDAVTAKLDALAIAGTHLETLETRNSDRLDFQEFSVSQLRDLMRAAYELGQHDNATASIAATLERNAKRRAKAAAKKGGR